MTKIPEPLRGRQADDQRQRYGLGQPAEEAAQEGRRREGEVFSRGDAATVQERRHATQRAGAIDVLQRDAGIGRVFAHDRDEARRQQRMPAEIDEEIGLQRQARRPQHALGGIEQRGFRGVARRLLLARSARRGQRRGLQHPPIDLAGDHPRQRADRLEMRRHHIGRQLLAQRRTQHGPVDRDAGLGHDEGDETLDLVIRPHHHGRLVDARLLGELGFDLAELDAEAADLDLVVDAPVEDDAARPRRG